MKKLILLLSVLLCSAHAASAITTLDPIVVTATRTATPLSEISSSVTVISAEEIEARQQPLVVDLLRGVPGVNLTRPGGPGGAVSIYLRGTENKHTLVLIDGVEVNNPSAVGGVADLANLTTDNIEQIEIVRGAQSVLYGSDAIGGVINIITRKGTGKPTAYASVSSGAYNTRTGAAGFSAAGDQGHIALSVFRTTSDGFSSANEKNGNSEDDGYRNTSFNLRTGFRPTRLFELNLSAGHTRAQSDYDYGFSTPPVDADNQQEMIELRGGIEGIFHLLEDRWQVKIAAGHTTLERRTLEESWGESRYQGTRNKLELQNTLHLDPHNTLVIGLESERSTAETSYGQNDHVTNRAVYAQNQFKLDALSATFGLRHDDHDEFGGHTTWKVAPSYTFDTTQTRIKGSLGTGFKAPTLYELYAPGFYDWADPTLYYPVGNRELEPEESLSWDFGFEQPLLHNSVIIGVTWFQNLIENYIDYDFVAGYQNTHDIRTQGLETTLEFYPSEFYDLRLSYSYTDTKNKKDGSRLLRRPLHNASADLNLHPRESVRLNLNLSYVGDRDDYGDTRLPGYTLANLAAGWQASEQLELFGRVDNLFDKDYEEASGYGTAGLSAYVGLKLSF